MRQTVTLSLLLAGLWLANSGHYTKLSLALGAVSVALVVAICHRMKVVDHETLPLHLSGHLPVYYAWLGKKIVEGNLDVAKRVWRGEPAISPCMQRLPLAQKTDLGRVIYANSISLTPGAMAVEVWDDSVLIHALTEVNIRELQDGEMNRRVRELEE